jgi:hypothetical protein
MFMRQLNVDVPDFIIGQYLLAHEQVINNQVLDLAALGQGAVGENLAAQAQDDGPVQDVIVADSGGCRHNLTVDAEFHAAKALS